MRIDAFSKQHPWVNFIFFMGAIVSAALIQHPIYLAVGIVSGAVYYLILNGLDGLKTIIRLIPLFVFLTAINPLFNTYGETVLFEYFNRPYTFEALIYGAVIAGVFVEMLLWFGCYNAVLTSDKFTSLFGNIIPSLSLLLVMVLRLIPNFIRKAKQISGARASIGKGTSENSSNKDKLNEGLLVLGALTSWAFEGSLVTSDSMKSRGYGTDKRTSFMLYKFNCTDILLLVLEIILLVFTVIFGNMKATFTPDFYIAKIGGLNTVGFVSYGIYLLIPAILNIKEAVQWHFSISKI